MLFSKVFKSNPIQTFDLTIAAGANDETIAFGPSSIINGTVKLFLDKPIKANDIRVVFLCQEWSQQKQVSTLLSVESSIWSPRQGSNDEPLENGSHIFLFAIQLPSTVNYPPTIRDSYLGHRIEYSLQGFLDFTLDNNTTIKTKSTPSVPLTYLPLVTFDEHMSSNAARMTKTIKIERENEYVQVTASLVNPSSCPGDLCSIKLQTHNKSSHSIHQVHLVLLSTATSLNTSTSKHPELPISSGPSYQNKQRQLLKETFYVTIPKHSSAITTTICPFRIPSFCVPTTQSHIGKYIDITYEVVIVIPAMGTNWEGSNSTSSAGLFLNTNAIRLPLFITTVPYSSTSPPKLQIPFADEHNTDIPSFIIHNESPLPSPITTEGWGPGSPIDPDDEDDTLFQLPSTAVTEDAWGHLMVPNSITSAGRPLSVHSTTSSVA